MCVCHNTFCIIHLTFNINCSEAQHEYKRNIGRRHGQEQAQAAEEFRPMIHGIFRVVYFTMLTKASRRRIGRASAFPRTAHRLPVTHQ